jgi:hypothetical protein
MTFAGSMKGFFDTGDREELACNGVDGRDLDRGGIGGRGWLTSGSRKGLWSGEDDIAMPFYCSGLMSMIVVLNVVVRQVGGYTDDDA